jgi:hypothetical protein
VFGRKQRDGKWNCGNATMTKTRYLSAFSSFGFLFIPARRWIPKLDVTGSNPVARSTYFSLGRILN